jgi:hypothetical protein
MPTLTNIGKELSLATRSLDSEYAHLLCTSTSSVEAYAVPAKPVCEGWPRHLPRLRTYVCKHECN